MDCWDSIVNHGETYATKHGSQQLGQTRYQIIWLGKSSMRWEQLLPRLQLHMLTRGHPAAIILHVGGNSIASIPQFTLMKAIKDDLNYIHTVFNSSALVWCDILPRLFWRHNKNDNSKALNLKTQRINRAAHQYMTKFSLARVISPHILWHMTELFDNDGTHLSEFGNLTYVHSEISFIL